MDSSTTLLVPKKGGNSDFSIRGASNYRATAQSLTRAPTIRTWTPINDATFSFALMCCGKKRGPSIDEALSCSFSQSRCCIVQGPLKPASTQKRSACHRNTSNHKDFSPSIYNEHLTFRTTDVGFSLASFTWRGDILAEHFPQLLDELVMEKAHGSWVCLSLHRNTIQ